MDVLSYVPRYLVAYDEKDKIAFYLFRTLIIHG